MQPSSVRPVKLRDSRVCHSGGCDLRRQQQQHFLHHQCHRCVCGVHVGALLAPPLSDTPKRCMPVRGTLCVRRCCCCGGEFAAAPHPHLRVTEVGIRPPCCFCHAVRRLKASSALGSDAGIVSCASRRAGGAQLRRSRRQSKLEMRQSRRHLVPPSKIAVAEIAAFFRIQQERSGHKPSCVVVTELESPSLPVQFSRILDTKVESLSEHEEAVPGTKRLFDFPSPTVRCAFPDPDLAASKPLPLREDLWASGQVDSFGASDQVDSFGAKNAPQLEESTSLPVGSPTHPSISNYTGELATPPGKRGLGRSGVDSPGRNIAQPSTEPLTSAAAAAPSCEPWHRGLDAYVHVAPAGLDAPALGRFLARSDERGVAVEPKQQDPQDRDFFERVPASAASSTWVLERGDHGTSKATDEMSPEVLVSSAIDQQEQQQLPHDQRLYRLAASRGSCTPELKAPNPDASSSVAAAELSAERSVPSAAPAGLHGLLPKRTLSPMSSRDRQLRSATIQRDTRTSVESPYCTSPLGSGPLRSYIHQVSPPAAAASTSSTASASLNRLITAVPSSFQDHWQQRQLGGQVHSTSLTSAAASRALDASSTTVGISAPLTAPPRRAEPDLGSHHLTRLPLARVPDNVESRAWRRSKSKFEPDGLLPPTRTPSPPDAEARAAQTSSQSANGIQRRVEDLRLHVRSLRLRQQELVKVSRSVDPTAIARIIDQSLVEKKSKQNEKNSACVSSFRERGAAASLLPECCCCCCSQRLCSGKHAEKLPLPRPKVGSGSR